MKLGTAVLAATAVALAACTGGTGPPSQRPSHSPVASPAGPTIGGTHTSPCPTPPPYAQPAPGRPRYTLGVNVNLARGRVIGKESVTFAPDLPVGHLEFRLWPNAPPQAAEGAHLAVGRAETPDGSRLASKLTDPTTLEVTPSSPLAGGQSITVSLPFTLTLPGAVLDRLSHDGSTVLLGSFFPVLPWVAGQGWALDPPTSTLAEASTDPTADFDVTIHVGKGSRAPEGLDILATGDHDGPDHWTATAVRDFAIVVGSFRIASNVLYAPDPITVTVGVEGGVATPPAQLLERIDETLGALTARYGPYPWKTFSLALVNVLDRSGIEYPNLVMEGANGIDRVTTHELAHQWFYSLVGNDQARDPWLDETLATWAAAQVDGFLPYFRHLKIKGVAADHVGSPMTFWDQHSKVYELGAYFRGVQALASLGSPAAVDCALRTYVAQRAYGIASSQDLLGALDSTIPDATAKLAPFGIHP